MTPARTPDAEQTAEDRTGQDAAHESTSDEPTIDPSVADALTERRNVRTRRRLAVLSAHVLLPIAIMALTLGAAFFKYIAVTADNTSTAESEALAAAREITIEMLAYEPATVEQTLTDVSQRLTGDFKEDYAALMRDVVIPGATAGDVTTVVSVPAAAIVSAAPTKVVTLLYVNQHVTVGTDPPTDTATTVEVTLAKDSSAWRVSGFEPV